MPSLRDVAQAAGVSVATASRVLSNNAHAVSSETRKRVLEVARSLQYSPNVIARALSSRRTNTMAMLVRDISDPYFSELSRAAEEHGRRAGYLSFLCNTDQNEAKEVAYLRALHDYHVDGIILAGGIRALSPTYREAINRIQQAKIPMVVVGSRPLELPSVKVDNVGSIRDLVDHLIELGHRRIAYISGPAGVTTARERFKGYEQALRQRGLAVDPQLVLPGDFTVATGRAAAIALAAMAKRPTAVVATNDQSAIGCMHELIRRGIRVPAEISVVGHGDQPGTADLVPPLTTVSVPIGEMGRTAMEMVLRMIRGEPVDSVVVPTQLVIRASSRPL